MGERAAIARSPKPVPPDLDEWGRLEPGTMIDTWMGKAPVSQTIPCAGWSGIPATATSRTAPSMRTVMYLVVATAGSLHALLMEAIVTDAVIVVRRS